MDSNTTYEQLIAQKLEQISVPDSADAIWAAIEQQLDIVMPVNTPSAGNTTMPKNVTPGIVVTAAIVVVTVALFIARTFNGPSTPVEKNMQIPINLPPVKLPDSSKKNNILKTTMYPENKSETSTVVQRRNADTAIVNTIQLPVIKKYSATYQPIINKVPVVDSIVYNKKKRGVTGISDDDYRLVPKDSIQ